MVPWLLDDNELWGEYLAKFPCTRKNVLLVIKWFLRVRQDSQKRSDFEFYKTSPESIFSLLFFSLFFFFFLFKNGEPSKKTAPLILPYMVNGNVQGRAQRLTPFRQNSQASSVSRTSTLPLFADSEHCFGKLSPNVISYCGVTQKTTCGRKEKRWTKERQHV